MEELRNIVSTIHPEVQAVAREDVKFENRKTLPYYSKYEYTSMIGVRAQQIADGAIPLIPLDKIQTTHPQFVWKVAEEEVKKRVLPFIIHRRLPNGESEYWSASELSSFMAN